MSQSINPTTGNNETEVYEEISVLPTNSNHSEDKTKEISEVNEKMTAEEERDQRFAQLPREPLAVHRGNAPNLRTILFVLTLVSTGVFAYLFMREFSLRRQDLSELVGVRQAKKTLEELVAQLKAEISQQRNDITRLVNDLNQANAKVAIVDTIRRDHQLELARLKNIYQGRLASIQRIIRVQNDFIKSFQSNLQSIRNLLERGATGVFASLPMDSAGGNVAPRLAPEMLSTDGRLPEGNVISVDREHRFIIVSLGPADGAKMGRFIQIYQNGASIGQGRIDRVYQNLSAATILSDDVLERVVQGDQVFLTFS